MEMNQKPGSRKFRGFPLFLSIILVFCILGAVVFSVSKKTTREMSESAIQNLSESLDLIKCTIEAVLRNEAEFQTMIAKEIAQKGDIENSIYAYESNETMVKLSLILSGETEGISSTGETFTEEGLDFSSGRTIDGLPVSESYVNYMGTWAYSMKCPVIKDEQEIAVLYVEYVYDTLDKSLPEGFYDNKATLYIMDGKSRRFVLKPKGMGQRSAGHLNLADFYRANSIEEENLHVEVEECIEEGKSILFYHDIRGVEALNYMWPLNDGSAYLLGYVPVEAIQQEGRTVTHNIYLVVVVMLAAFFLCCMLYYFNQRQQGRIRREREEEREQHNKQLAEALQAAQIASNSKTTFLSNMSHDIRTPMNAVLGFATLLAADVENPVKVREYIEKIKVSGQHLLSLINDILDVSKIESGKVVLSFEEFTLNDIVSSVEAIIQPMAKQKNQSFHVEVTDVKHEYLIGDETRLNQILINLLSNAVKYTPESGNIWFRIMGLKQRSSQYERIRIEVEDDGYGMTPEYLQTIFDAFTRAENSTTNKVQGTGLGMAITKSIVELMGGTIDVFSEVNKGSLFRVELELRIPEDQAEQQFWQSNGIKRILAAGSDKEFLDDIQARMEGVGVRTDIAFHIKDALTLIEETDEKYSFILLDFSIPEAAEAAERLRETLPDVPLLLLSESEDEKVKEGLRIENTGILLKPFFVSALKEKFLEMAEEKAENICAKEALKENLKGMHFLAAEDNEINAEILTDLLEFEGATCEIVENGQLVVERFECAPEGEFDAILMDVQMPVMNGYDATKAIRALSCSEAKRIPIIAMTANAFAEDERAALDAGMDAHVAKPVNIESLKKIIGQYKKERDII